MKPSRAFTLIELLVVIAIIAILAAILFPVFSSAKEAAKRTACLSNAKQIGTSLQMYLTDYDGTMPIFYAYNSQPAAGQPGHKGVEVLLAPYVGSGTRRQNGSTGLNELFKCPLDVGGPYTSQDVPGSTSYWNAYGSSYRFGKCMFSVVAGESSGNNSTYTYTNAVGESGIADPANTRVIRDEMMAAFSRANTPNACSKYGYDCDPPNNYFTRWHSTGGTVVFADCHAKHIAGAGGFDKTLVNPQGNASGESHPTDGTWYWACD